LTDINRQITAMGPLVELTVGPSSLSADALIKHGLPAPQPMAVMGLIDTGATLTTVNSSLVQRMGLDPVGSRRLLTATGITPCYLYQISISLADHAIPSWDVLEARQDFRTFDLLIGRDILNRAVFHYDGPRGIFTLTFE
jgi:hypothetical protein